MTEAATVYEMMRYRTASPSVVIIDDQSTGRMVLSEIMRVVDPRINVRAFSDPSEAIEYVRSFAVDLVVTDYMMPRLNGVQTTRELRKLYSAEQLPIVMTTIVHSRELLYRAFEAGISDYLLRPLDPVECRLRFENLLSLRSHFLAASRKAELLTGQVEQLRSEVHELGVAFFRRLAGLVAVNAMEFNEPANDVPIYAALIGRAMGESDDEVNLLRCAAALHDVGELALPAPWRHVAGPLSQEHRMQMQRHTTIGHELLSYSSAEVVRAAAEIALHHHERLDGSGYPQGLCGTAIPRRARIVAVADVFNALLSARPWRPPFDASQALNTLSGMRAQLDSQAIDALWASLEKEKSGQLVRTDAVSAKHHG